MYKDDFYDVVVCDQCGDISTMLILDGQEGSMCEVCQAEAEMEEGFIRRDLEDSQRP